MLAKLPAMFGPSDSTAEPLVTAIAAPAERWPKLRIILQAALGIVPLAEHNNARVTIEAMKD